MAGAAFELDVDVVVLDEEDVVGAAGPVGALQLQHVHLGLVEVQFAQVATQKRWRLLRTSWARGVGRGRARTRGAAYCEVRYSVRFSGCKFVNFQILRYTSSRVVK